MNIDEYENGGRVLYADFAEAVAAILRAAVAEHNDLRLQNIQHRAKEVDLLRAKVVKAEASADTTIGDIAKDVSGCRLCPRCLVPEAQSQEANGSVLSRPPNASLLRSIASAK
jgi:hypothetical protein